MNMPNGTTIQSSHTCNLLLTDLPPQARQAHILQGLVHNSLISVGQLCDNECSVTFTQNPKQQKTKNTLAPQDGIENNAPQRVQTTVSPPRVAGTDTEKIYLQPISSSQSTPNSHRRQKTPVRQIVTPQTSHVRVRRSARQQNLSQDMMAETINQANHCFAISAQTQYTKKPGDNTEVILLP
jgi:hypothetical protein